MKRRRKSFDVVNRFRLPFLACLKDRELDAGEIAAITGKSRSSVHYHFKILKKAGLVEESIQKKTTCWTYAARKFKEIHRFHLTAEGVEALEYFGGLLNG